MRKRTALRHGFLGVHDCRQLFVLDLDQVRRVHGLALALRQHRGDDLALVADLFLGDREPLRDVFLLGDEGRGRGVRPGELGLEVARRVHARDARRLARVGDVDALDLRKGAADKDGVPDALTREVVDVMAVAGDQARVLAAVDLGSD